MGDRDWSSDSESSDYKIVESVRGQFRLHGSNPHRVSREFRRSLFDSPDTSLSSISAVCPSFKFLPERVPPLPKVACRILHQEKEGEREKEETERLFKTRFSPLTDSFSRPNLPTALLVINEGHIVSGANGHKNCQIQHLQNH